MFPDQQTAKQWAKWAGTAKRVECQRVLLEEANQGNSPDLTLRTGSNPALDASIGTEPDLVAASMYEFIEGGQVTSHMYTQVYQVGRGVVTVRTQFGAMPQGKLENLELATRTARITAFDAARNAATSTQP